MGAAAAVGCGAGVGLDGCDGPRAGQRVRGRGRRLVVHDVGDGRCRSGDTRAALPVAGRRGRGVRGPPRRSAGGGAARCLRAAAVVAVSGGIAGRAGRGASRAALAEWFGHRRGRQRGARGRGVPAQRERGRPLDRGAGMGHRPAAGRGDRRGRALARTRGTAARRRGLARCGGCRRGTGAQRGRAAVAGGPGRLGDAAGNHRRRGADPRLRFRPGTGRRRGSRRMSRWPRNST